MMGHTATMWQYLGSFVGYTLVAIGFIYAAYWFMRKQPNNWFTGTAFQKPSAPQPIQSALQLEACLPLDPTKSLYIVRAGQERFLISTTMDQTQYLSKLESESSRPAMAPAMLEEMQIEIPEEKVELPWFAKERTDTPETPFPQQHASKPGFGMRLAQSVRWLIESRK